MSKSANESQLHNNSGIHAESAEAEVRQVLDGYAKAVALGNLDQIIEFYSPDATVYGMMPPLQIMGRDAYRKICRECLTTYFKFPLQFAFSEQTIKVAGNTAVAFGLLHTRGEVKADGKTIDNWLRSTIVLQRQAEGWKIINEHNSVPIDGISGRAMMNLTPDFDFTKTDKPTNVNRNHDA